MCSEEVGSMERHHCNIMSSEDDDSLDKYDDGSSKEAERKSEASSSEIRPSAESFATSSVALPSADTSSKDDQKLAAKEYAPLSDVIINTAAAAVQSSNTKVPSPASTQVIPKSQKRREHDHKNESRFSFREPFLDKVSCKICKACFELGLLFTDL